MQMLGKTQKSTVLVVIRYNGSLEAINLFSWSNVDGE